MKRVSIKLKLTLWFMASMLALAAVIFGFVSLLSAAETRRQTQNALISLVEANEDEVEYEDGEIFSIPLVYGLNITGKDRVWERHYQGDLSENIGLAERDTWSFDSKLAEVSRTTLPFRRGKDTWFRIAVPDPHPEKQVTAVRVIKTCEDEGDILLGRFARFQAAEGE